MYQVIYADPPWAHRNRKPEAATDPTRRRSIRLSRRPTLPPFPAAAETHRPPPADVAALASKRIGRQLEGGLR